MRKKQKTETETAMKSQFKAENNTPFLPLFKKLDEMLVKGRVVLAVEGRSASGKSTLAVALKERYNAAVFHTDDFFLRPEQRTAERYAEPGGNLDRERLLQEIIVPLCKNEPVVYRAFNCADFTLSAPIELRPERLTVIEGAYSMHPFFGDYCDLSVFLEISSELQRERILKRNTPEQAEAFFDKWIPLENEYFLKLEIRQRCDMIIQIK